MSDDPREDILAHLHTLLQGISGIASCWRNRDEIGDDEEDTALPAVILLDGREEIANQSDIERTRAVKMLPAIMRLYPEIIVQLKPRENAQNLLPEPVGPELSDWRMKIMAAIINDPGLVGDQRHDFGLLGPNGQIVYLGCETDMRKGATMIGQMMVGFCLHYTLPLIRA